MFITCTCGRICRNHTAMPDRQISANLAAWHLFGAAAILRRTLVELTLVPRSAEYRAYRRPDQPPPPEAIALIRLLRVP